MIHQPLGKIDCFGITRKHPHFERNSDRFIIAEVRPSLRIHRSTESPTKSLAKSPEDQCVNFFGQSQGQLLMIADGVGDRSSAARASAVVVDTVNSHLLNAVNILGTESESDGLDLLEEFKTAIDASRDVMQREVEAADRFDSMGAVITLVFVAWPTAYILHVGNNRLYHQRNHTIQQITKDHTVARRLVDAGELSPGRARESKLRSLIWNFVGTQAENTLPEFEEIELEVGDALVLCTDGLTAAVDAPHLSEALRESESAANSCNKLIDIAELHGLNDDATVVIARFTDPAKPLGQIAAVKEDPLPTGSLSKDAQSRNAQVKKMQSTDTRAKRAASKSP